MKRVFTITLILLSALPLVAHAQTVVDWTLETADGESIRLDDEVKKQPVILLFWATWCPYCKALMPHLQSIRLEYGNQVKILAINFREDGDPIAFIREHGYDFTLFPEGDEVAGLYGIHGTPGVIIVDRERRMRFDLRMLPPRNPPPSIQSTSHKSIAAYRAPYWAAAIRKTLDTLTERDVEED